MHVKNIKIRILNFLEKGVDVSWCQGFISGLYSLKGVTKEEFNILINWIGEEEH